MPYDQYRRYMQDFVASAPRTATRERVREALSHLVVSQPVLDQLGPAINSGHSMFVYGPPGNGKTVIAQAIRKLLTGEIAIPHAIEVEGAIIRLFDPVNHEPIDDAVDERERLDLSLRHDRRWVRCRRPMVMVGGELTLTALDLSYNPTTGFYRAPVQAVANGGVLVIDDFGRQQCAPRDLLNRWIVPLESRVDYLTLQIGPEVRDAVRRPGGVRHQHQAGRARRRGVSPAHSLQGLRQWPDGRGIHADLRELLPGPQPGVRSGARRTAPERVLRAAQDRAARLPSARPDRPEPLARRLPRRAASLTAELLDAACAGYFVDEREGSVS